MKIHEYNEMMRHLTRREPSDKHLAAMPLYEQGGRVGYQSGQLVQPGPGRQGYGGKGSGYSLDELFPKLEKRAIQLLNSGLAPIDVSRQLEEEGIIKVKSYERAVRPGRGDTPGLMKKSYKPFNEYYKKLLADNKLKITEIPKTVTGSLKSQEEIAKLDKIIVEAFENNPDLSAERIAKKVSTEVNQTISNNSVISALKRAGVDYVGKARKILPEIEALDKLVKKSASFLEGKSKILEKRKSLFDAFKKAIGNKNYDSKLFDNRLKRLNSLYTGTGIDRTADKIYQNIKAPKNYIESALHKNIAGLLKDSTRGIVGTAEILGLPQKDIDFLKDMQKGIRELSGGITIHGDHTDIDALMRNFPDYRKNFMRINYIKESLNNLKSKTDQSIVKLFKEAKDLEGNNSFQAIKRRNEIMANVKNLKASFVADTGVDIGEFKLDKTGKPFMDFKTKRISDIDSPRWTKLRELTDHLDLKSDNIVDQMIRKGKNIKETLTKWKGSPEIANSQFIKSFSKMGGKFGKLTKALIGGTIGAAGITTLANASGTDVTEAGMSIPSAGQLATGALTTSIGSKFMKSDPLKYLRKAFRKVGSSLLTPTGAGVLWGATGGFDYKDPLDRAALGAEAAFAPELVRWTSKLTKPIKNQAVRDAVTRSLNLFMTPKTAMKAARVASPIGLLSLAGEGLYHMYEKGHFDKERMMPSLMDRTAYDEAQREEFELPDVMFKSGGRVLLGKGKIVKGIDEGRRAFMKLLAALGIGTATAGAGLIKFGKGAKTVAPQVTEEVIKRNAEGMPTYIDNLINVVQSKGIKKLVDSNINKMPDTVHTYKGVEITQDAAGNTRIKKGKEISVSGSDEPGYHELEMEINRGGIGVKDEGLETQKTFQEPDEYFEGTVRPDIDGKMKDVDFHIDDADHIELKKIADEGTYDTYLPDIDDID